MDFIIVTSTENSVLLDLNFYASFLTTPNYLLDKKDVARIVERIDFVEVWLHGVKEPYLFSFELNQYNAMVIQSVNGSLVTSIPDLFQKLKYLKDPLI